MPPVELGPTQSSHCRRSARNTQTSPQCRGTYPDFNRAHHRRRSPREPPGKTAVVPTWAVKRAAPAADSRTRSLRRAARCRDSGHLTRKGDLIDRGDHRTVAFADAEGVADVAFRA